MITEYSRELRARQADIRKGRMALGQVSSTGAKIAWLACIEIEKDLAKMIDEEEAHS